MRDSCLAATSKYVIIHVEPFLPDLVKTVFKSYCPNFSEDDLLALYAFTGGVAQYIQNFLPMGAFTLEDMLQLGVEENSVWLSEAQLMLTSEFKGSAQTYHEILRRIAAGKNKRAELIRSFSIDVSAHLYQLQHEYALIESLNRSGKTAPSVSASRTNSTTNCWISGLPSSCPTSEFCRATIRKPSVS